MGLKDLQLIDNEPIDNSIVKRVFSKTYNQQKANLNDPDQNFQFVSGENNNYHQCGNSYLEFDVTVRNPTANSENNNQIRLINNPYAQYFKEASLATTAGMEIEHVKFSGQISTFMRSLTSRDGDFLSHFDNSNEGNTAADFILTPFKQMLFDNHTVEVKKCKIKGQFPLEHIFGFCKLKNDY